MRTCSRGNGFKRMGMFCGGLFFLFMLMLWTGSLEARADDGSGDDDLRAVYGRLAGGERIHGGVQPAYEVPDHPTLYLTFDDGPSRLTPKVLDILKEEGVKATFFEIGQEAAKYPDTVKRVVEEGHSLGNHTFDHVYSDLYSDYGRFWKQVQQSEDVFMQTVGFRPTLLRAPGGTATNFDSFYFYNLETAGYTVVDWNMDSTDASRKGITAKEIVDAVRKGPFPRQAVLLMHDGTGHDASVAALRDVIGIFKEKGYEFAALGERVKPVQFGLRPLKWKRSTSFEEFVRNVGEARVHSSLLKPEQEPAGQQGGGKVSMDSGMDNEAGTGQAVSAPPKLPEPPLTVYTAGKTWTQQPGEYEFRQGRFAVSLDGLAGLLGGRVEWDEQTSTATYRCGLYAAQYDFRMLTLREYWPGRTRVTHLPDMRRMDNGKVFVPLRAAAEANGYRIDSYRISDQEGVREVFLSERVTVPLPFPRFQAGIAVPGNRYSLESWEEVPRSMQQW